MEGGLTDFSILVCGSDRYNLEENDFYLDHPNKIVYAIQRNTSGLFLIARKYQSSASCKNHVFAFALL